MNRSEWRVLEQRHEGYLCICNTNRWQRTQLRHAGDRECVEDTTKMVGEELGGTHYRY